MEKPTTELLLDESKRDRRGRRITSAARIEQLLRDYDQSGLTQAAFARHEGVKYATFAHWVQARRARGGATLAHNGGKPVRFAEVKLPALRNRCPEVGGLSVTMPDGLVVRGTDAANMAALVRALTS